MCHTPSIGTTQIPHWGSSVSGKGSSASLDLSAATQLLGNTDMYSTQTTGQMDVRQLHNVYVRSCALANNHCIGPIGCRDTAAKDAGDGLTGNILHRSNGLHTDYIDVGGKQLSTLDFFITDFEGNAVDLRGGV